MKITDLIHQAGEKLVWQWLRESFISANQVKKGTHITFGTNAVSALELATGDEKYVGMIVWFPKEMVEAKLAECRKEKPCHE